MVPAEVGVLTKWRIVSQSSERLDFGNVVSFFTCIVIYERMTDVGLYII